MNLFTIILLFITGLFAGILLLLEVGRRLALRRRAQPAADAGAGLGAGGALRGPAAPDRRGSRPASCSCRLSTR